MNALVGDLAISVLANATEGLIMVLINGESGLTGCMASKMSKDRTAIGKQGH